MRIISYVRSLLFAGVLLAISAAAYPQIGISNSFAPPELPVYEQPLLPGDGYIWTPGYWASMASPPLRLIRSRRDPSASLQVGDRA